MKIRPNSDVKYICQYVLSELKHKLPSRYTYHDVRHTMDVIETASHYAEVYQLDQKERGLLTIAAVCHDYGYLVSPENHEMTSADMASMIMAAYQYQDRDIRKVREMIMATSLNVQPSNLLQAIMSDSDLDYLGRKDYFEVSNRLRKEMANMGSSMDDAEWLDLQIRFFENHSYHTIYAQKNRQPLKEKHLEALKVRKEQLTPVLH